MRFKFEDSSEAIDIIYIMHSVANIVWNSYADVSNSNISNAIVSELKCGTFCPLWKRIIIRMETKESEKCLRKWKKESCNECDLLEMF